MSQLKNVYQKLRTTFDNDPKTKLNILTEVKGDTFNIIFNRPKRFNAFSNDMFYSFIDIIKNANEMPEISFIVLRGNGGNFSSGYDLTNLTDPRMLELGDSKTVGKISA